MGLTPTTRGVYAIAPTPFDESGEVDHASIETLVEFYRRSGVDGITVLGLLGEVAKLTDQESREVVRRFVSTAGDLPVVVGVSAPGFRQMAGLSDDAMAAGAAGAMIAPAATLSTDEQITQYFANACSAVGASTPVVVQDFPLNSGVRISTTVLARIFSDNDNAVVLKHEDWPGLDKITALRNLIDSGGMPQVSILTGFGGAFLDCEMRRGASGAMTGYAFPELLVEVVGRGLAGEFDAMQEAFDAHLPYLRYEQQPGIGLAARKYVLHRRGAIASAAQRVPTVALSEQSRAEVDHLIARLMPSA
ncbi:dihydrodipicolinate synthase family protein [Pseudonocardia nematodicida]|uniref:Dihydrodipicolinate synthase family protein n=1 Tax=Pseudonocardia nematodicida TaxID=1206997 RepID=A0ABV1KDT5_9PSEU